MRERLFIGLKPDAFNIGVNDGLAAGQTIEHVMSTSFHGAREMYQIRAAASAGSLTTRQTIGRYSAAAHASRADPLLENVQRLLAEGLFTATYKYALLTALADLSVQLGDDSGDPLPLSTFAIAEKFVEYYWRHAIPYATANGERILRQNTGGPAKVISLVEDARKHRGDSLASLMRDERGWRRLVRNVEQVVKGMPLWKLQTVGKEKLDFLYKEHERGAAIELRPGVAFCCRQFYVLIQDAVRSAWLRDVRSLNGDLLGETMDLREFLFGAERNALRVVRPVLMDLQQGKCFYCALAI